MKIALKFPKYGHTLSNIHKVALNRQFLKLMHPITKIHKLLMFTILSKIPRIDYFSLIKYMLIQSNSPHVLNMNTLQTECPCHVNTCTMYGLLGPHFLQGMGRNEDGLA